MYAERPKKSLLRSASTSVWSTFAASGPVPGIQHSRDMSRLRGSTLQRNETPVFEHFQMHGSLVLMLRIPRVELLSKPRKITVAPPGVGNDVELRIRVPCNNCVVDDPAVLVEQD